MLCSILRGGDASGTLVSNAWGGRRSVEIIGHHHDKELINILFMFYLENKFKDGIPNYLYVLHPGAFDFELVRSWPAQKHVDEPEEKGCANILDTVYKRAFTELGEQLYQTVGLTAWDSWYDFAKEPVAIWPHQEENYRTIDNYIKKYYPENIESFLPFTVLRLGPFTKSGANLISLKLTIYKEACNTLLGHGQVFSIDGPESLLLRIERNYISKLPPQHQDAWKKELHLFDRYINFGESYDVILLKHPYASSTEIVWKDGIVEAPIQPNKKVAERYITRNYGFCLGLKYSDVNIHQTK